MMTASDDSSLGPTVDLPQPVKEQCQPARCNGILRLLAEIISIAHVSTFFISEGPTAPSDVLQFEATTVSTLLFSGYIALGKMAQFVFEVLP